MTLIETIDQCCHNKKRNQINIELIFLTFSAFCLRQRGRVFKSALLMAHTMEMVVIQSLLAHSVVSIAVSSQNNF